MRTAMRNARRAILAVVFFGLAHAAAGHDAAHPHEPDPEERALGSLIDAELAFAQMASAKGIRAAFLAYVAPDAVVMEPVPLRLHDAWPTRPASATADRLRLEWKSAQVGVARSHDFGYSTGPFELTDTTAPGHVTHGVFFSVWVRDEAGAWKVVLDTGVTAPLPVDFVELGAAPRPGFTGKSNLDRQRREILARESGLAPAASGKKMLTYAELLAPDARLHRAGLAPVVGRVAVARAVAQHASAIRWKPLSIQVSRSGDMAFTYGKLRTPGVVPTMPEGYYVHLWLRDGRGRWRLAYDIVPGPQSRWVE